MSNSEYLKWIDVNCPIGVKKEFATFLAMKTVSLMEQSSKNTGYKISLIIYIASKEYKNFYKQKFELHFFQTNENH